MNRAHRSTGGKIRVRVADASNTYEHLREDVQEQDGVL